MAEGGDASRSVLPPRADQPAIDLSVAFDFLVERIPPNHELSTRPAEANSTLRIAGERRRHPLELRLVAEEQPRLAVVDDRTIAVDVGREHGATEPERLEHPVGHAHPRTRAVHEHHA